MALIKKDGDVFVSLLRVRAPSGIKRHVTVNHSSNQSPSGLEQHGEKSSSRTVFCSDNARFELRDLFRGSVQVLKSSIPYSRAPFTHFCQTQDRRSSALNKRGARKFVAHLSTCCGKSWWQWMGRVPPDSKDFHCPARLLAVSGEIRIPVKS